MSQSGLQLPRSTEVEIRALALAKVKASKAYTDALYASREGKSDDELVDLELRLVEARKAFNAACTAFDRAV